MTAGPGSNTFLAKQPYARQFARGTLGFVNNVLLNINAMRPGLTARSSPLVRAVTAEHSPSAQTTRSQFRMKPRTSYGCFCTKQLAT